MAYPVKYNPQTRFTPKPQQSLGDFGRALDISGLAKELMALKQTVEKKLEELNQKSSLMKGEKGDRGPRGYDGVNGKDGKDGKDGKNGVNGTNGKDGKFGRDGKSFNPEEFVKEFQKHLDTGKVRVKTTHIDGYQDATSVLRNYAARGFLHGGGDTVIAGSGVTVTQGSDGRKTLSATGSTFYENEVVSGSGTSFTLAHTPIAGSVKIFGKGQRLTSGAGNDYTISGTAIITANSWNAGDILADYRA